jgi:HD-like signal output (HDOD) protein
LPKVLEDLFEAKLAAGEVELPLLPETSARVLASCHDEHCEARELAELIQRDQALAVHVLRLANSAAYAPNEAIVSLQQAVSRLGLAAICEIAIAAALKGRVFRVPGHQPKVREMWRHSAMAGSYAKEIARVRRFNVEGAFSAGLMHDVGKPMVMMAFIDLWAEISDERPRYEQLEAAVETFHARVGSLLVERWRLPAWIGQSILHHDDYRQAKAHREDVMSTSLADELAKWAGQPDLAEGDFDLDLPVIADLNLYHDDVQHLLERRRAVLDVAQPFL